jgi:hypothetical protein
MPNHIHLFIETREVPLSRVMHGLQLSYTQHFNRRYDDVGHLFQGRYIAILCDRDAYLLELVRYIHLNPHRAGLADHLTDYLWTSHSIYLGRKESSLVNPNLVLAQFHQRIDRARRAYQEFLEAGIGMGHQEWFYRVEDQRLLGSQEFVEEVKERVREAVVPPELSLEQILTVVSKEAGIEPDCILSKSHERKGAVGRALLAYFAIRASTHKGKEVASYLHREPATITIALRKLEERLKTDMGLKELIRRIGNELRIL